MTLIISKLPLLFLHLWYLTVCTCPEKMRISSCHTTWHLHIHTYFLTLVSLSGSWGGCCSWSQLHMGEGRHTPEWVASSSRAYRSIWGLWALVEGTLAVLWRCPSTTSYHQNSFQHSKPEHEPTILVGPDPCRQSYHQVLVLRCQSNVFTRHFLKSQPTKSVFQTRI